MVADTGSKSKSLATDFPKTRRKWYYDPATSGITTEVTGIRAEITIYGNPK